jgi:hypothetical protein
MLGLTRADVDLDQNVLVLPWEITSTRARRVQSVVASSHDPLRALHRTPARRSDLLRRHRGEHSG